MIEFIAYCIFVCLFMIEPNVFYFKYAFDFVCLKMKGIYQ